MMAKVPVWKKVIVRVSMMDVFMSQEHKFWTNATHGMYSKSPLLLDYNAWKATYSSIFDLFSTCKSGSWECTKEKCPGTCIIYGSGHYNTFDERTYGFQGDCAYIAVKVNTACQTIQELEMVKNGPVTYLLLCVLNIGTDGWYLATTFYIFIVIFSVVKWNHQCCMLWNTLITNVFNIINAFLSFSFKDKCDNTTLENTFGVITENIPCGSTAATCSKTVRVQLGVSAKEVGSYLQLHICIFSTLPNTNTNLLNT